MQGEPVSGMLTNSQDAYGHQLFDYYRGRSEGLEIVERDDGFIQANQGPKNYLSRHASWPTRERLAIKLARGRVLDIGCGGARHSLYLQARGHNVLGIDVSPLAVKVSRLRGLKDARILSITDLDSSLGKFDTILMLGNNFGLFANRGQAKRLLRKFHGLTNPGAQIIAESLDPYKTSDPDHLRYHRFNRGRGRMAGQVRIRVRYRRYASPWFDYLLVSRAEMRGIVEGTGWRIQQFISSKTVGQRRTQAVYIAIIRRLSGSGSN